MSTDAPLQTPPAADRPAAASPGPQPPLPKGKAARAAQEAERRRRQDQAALNAALAAKSCRNCSVLGNWEVYDRDRTAGRVRYIRCKACGYCDHVPVIVKRSDHETSEE